MRERERPRVPGASLFSCAEDVTEPKRGLGEQGAHGGQRSLLGQVGQQHRTQQRETLSAVNMKQRQGKTEEDEEEDTTRLLPTKTRDAHRNKDEEADAKPC